MFTDQDFKNLHKQFKYLEEKIKEYDSIAVYRHTSPDFDALGAQMGLVTWIKDNFPDKDVRFIGDRHPTFMPDLFPYPEEVSEDWFHQVHLAITVDISNFPRLANKDTLKFAKEVIKIDHHPAPDKPEDDFGDYKIVYPERPAASELLALFMLSRSRKLRLSKQAAYYLYCGIVGDTGRFLYQDSDAATLRISADLLQKGFDKTSLYDKMYETDERRIQILRFCLNNYKLTEKGTCYYILKKEDLEALHMTVDEGNLHINQFRNMKGVRVVCSITWDEAQNHYRVSLRSAHLVVAPVAVKFNGGGHDFAAGCKLDSLDEVPSLIAALDAIPDNQAK